MNLHLPNRICRDVAAALQREWLVTNGLGGFAAGTVAGALTRRYHGLLVAALKPPLGRRLLVAKLDEQVELDGAVCPLSTNVWQSGVAEPNGCGRLARFDLRLGVPTWTYALGEARLVKRVWMEPGRNVTYVQYELAAGSGGLPLACRLLVTDRDYHHLHRGAERHFAVQPTDNGLNVALPYTGVPLRVRWQASDGLPVQWRTEAAWWWAFHLPIEAERGFDHLEDHFAAGVCAVTLKPGASVTFRLAAGDDTRSAGPPSPASARDGTHALTRRHEHAQARLAEWSRRTGRTSAQTPVPVAQLVLAAEQFVVARPTPEAPDGHTVIAGYPWFTDWGRDTMIALPGLTLVTGRFDIARQVLRTWARHVRDGLIPNRFPDAGEQPEYHTADATLWYLWAVDQYVRATGDTRTLAELFPTLRDVVDWHRRGTRHNIHVADDGLIYAGEPGVNLTWMDAKIGDRVITPRIGKPVELSALWYDALCNLARMADEIEQPGEEYRRLAERTRAAFARFWNPPYGCCHDVLDGPSGNEAAVRPNQVFAVSLVHSPLTTAQQAAVVETCEKRLLAWFGLRSLAPGEPGYRGRYAGGPVQRDEAYHQGTAWGWLLGPFVIAHFRVHGSASAARHFLEPALGQLWTAGVGSLSEIYDGDEPHAANGCPAQAWSVAETLRAWWVTQCGGVASA
ncbi:MAG: amylo-alpha-1,6-glucosidase [Planctomycetota bacterium]